MSKSIIVRCEKCGTDNRIKGVDLDGTKHPICGKCRHKLRLGTGKVWDVTDADFSPRVLDSGLPVLVDCWAPWCGPCRTIAPVLDRIAARYKYQLHVARLNVDDNALTAARYGISSIPTILLMRNGEVIERIVGAVPERVMEEALRKRKII